MLPPPPFPVGALLTTVVPAELDALTGGLVAAAFAPSATFSPLVADDGTSSDAR